MTSPNNFDKIENSQKQETSHVNNGQAQPPIDWVYDQAAAHYKWLGVSQIDQLQALIENFVPGALQNQKRFRQAIRRDILPDMCNRPGASSDARWGIVSTHEVDRARAYLLAGGAAAVDGSCTVVGTPAMSAVGITTARVAHDGAENLRAHRFTNDYIARLALDPDTQSKQLLEAIANPSSGQNGSQSQLMARALMALAERRHLLSVSSKWRFGHGGLVDFAMLTMAADPKTIVDALNVLTAIVNDRQFVFVCSQPADVGLVLLADALEPREYAVVGGLDTRLRPIFNSGHYRGTWAKSLSEISKFVDAVACDVRVGIYRSNHEAGGRVFYAHKDDVGTAALLAIADSSLQPVRGFPMLIDRADYACSRSVISASALSTQFDLSMLGAGGMLQHLSERATRYARTA